MMIHMTVTCLAICIVCWIGQIIFDWITAPLIRWIDKRTKTLINIEAYIQNEVQ
jgi:hypothetical protein